MTILLSGADSYRRGQRLREVVRQFLAKYPGVGVLRFDASLDADVSDRLREALGSSSLFSPRTLAVVTDALALPAGELSALVEKSAQSEVHHLVLTVDTDSVPQSHARLAATDVKQEVFSLLRGDAWRAFTAREAAARSLALSPQQAELLSRVLAGDSWALATELDTLAATPPELRGARLAEVSALFREPTSLQWGDLRSLVGGSYPNRLRLLARHDAGGDAAAKTFAMAAYLANPRTAADADAAIKAGQWNHEEALLALVCA